MSAIAEWGIIAIGKYSFISRYDQTSVLKGYVVYRDEKEVAFIEDESEAEKVLKREQQIYEILQYQPHPHVLEFKGTIEVAPGKFSLRLEHAIGKDLRTHIAQNSSESHKYPRLKWARDVVSAVKHIHSHNIRHCDISCRNILLNNDGEVKLGDFGGSAIDDQEALVSAEARYQLPLRGRSWDNLPHVQEEIFAVGCAIYEILAWQIPHSKITSDDEVRKCYDLEDFPDLNGIALEDIIRKCWTEKFENMAQVEEALLNSTR